MSARLSAAVGAQGLHARDGIARACAVSNRGHTRSARRSSPGTQHAFAFHMSAIRHILVATNFSSISNQALAQAVDLAEQVGATITLVHAHESITDSFANEARANGAALPAGTPAALDEAFAGDIARFEKRKVAFKTVVRRGQAWEEITAVAESERADLVVVGTHARTGLARALFGSVAERLIRNAPCPVLVVRGDTPSTPLELEDPSGLRW